MPRGFDYRILDETAHRPWPMRRSPWIMTQSWHDLLFAHWPVAPSALAPLVPPPLRLDLHDGAAWVGIVPFTMSHVAPRGLPAPRRLSAFPELNVRTYVRAGGKGGVFFFSLDAASAMAVALARAVFGLPYYRATMQVSARGGTIDYVSRRNEGGAEFVASYEPTGAPAAPRPGTLEHFLTERYCLFTVGPRGRTFRVDIHHPPWPLQPAAAALSVNTMAEAAGIALPRREPLLHFARRQDVVAWMPTRVRDATESSTPLS